MTIEFSKERMNKVQEIINKYPAGKQKSALLPVLHLAQEQFNGWLDVPVMVECLGACGYAPMMQLGKHYREHLTPTRVDEIVEECRKQAALATNGNGYQS